MVSEIGLVLLNTSRERWNSTNNAIPNSALSAFFSLSICVEPLVAGPCIEASWKAQWESFTDLAGRHSGDDDLASAAGELVKFLELVTENEPRLLRQKAFPERFDSVMESWLEGVAQFDPMDMWPCSDDEASTYIDTVDLFSNYLERLTELFPSLQQQMSEEVKRLESRKERLEKARDEQAAENKEKQDEEERAQQAWIDDVEQAAAANSPQPDVSTESEEPRRHFSGVPENLPCSVSELFDDL